MLRKLNSIVTLTVLLCTAAIAQTPMNLDSLLQLLPKTKNDSAKVLLYINIGQQYEGAEPNTAKQYYRMAGTLAKKINFPLGVIKYITNYTYLLNANGLYDSGLVLNLQSVELAKQIHDSMYIAKTLFNVGTSYKLMDDYENAVHYYEEGKKVFALIGVTGNEAQSNDILQGLYQQMHQFNKGIEYGEKAVAKSRIDNDSSWLCSSLNNLGLNYLGAKRYKKAQEVFEEGLAIAIKTGNKTMQAALYLNLADVRFEQGDMGELSKYYYKVLELSAGLEQYENTVIALKGLSFEYQYRRDYVTAKKLADSAMQIAKKYGYRVQQGKLYSHLSNLAYSMQDMKLAEQYAKMSGMIQDSILNEAVEKSVQDAETKYATRQKEEHIKRLEDEKRLQQLAIRQKNLLNIILVVTAVALVALALLIYRTYRNRQRLQLQRIQELEKEKQLTATEAVLKGEEKERLRLAKDLHDGLGGMLSGIKYSLSTMKGNLYMSADNALAFERSIDMLDSSIQEMRRIAHNMMPEALVKFGLEVALKDLCHDINASGAIRVDAAFLGMQVAVIDHTTSITIYRIVQELLNNSIKHAAARHAIVQLTKQHGQLTITVEDDGKGFDTAILRQTRGAGWSNILNRVEFLKGKLDVNAQPGKGTSVLIELNV